MKDNKKVLRLKFKTKLQQLSNEDLKNLNNLFFRKMKFFLNENPFKKIGIYLSYGVEPETYELIEYALKKGIKVYVPKIIDDQKMDFYEINDLNNLVKHPKYGIYEPVNNDENKLKNPNSLDVLFIPLTVFDQNLNRIGSGKGYYDRWINFHKFQGLKVGLAHQISYSSELIIYDEFDVNLDYVITESKVYGW